MFGLALSFLLIGQAFSQVVNIPDKSKEHFAKKYPKVKNPNWDNSITYYMASFTMKKESYRAVYHMDGTWDFTEKKIDKSKLPNAVSASFEKSRFAGWETRSFAFVENNEGQKLYRIEVKKGIEKKYVFYDKDGKEIKTTASI
jgi:hypothetical protein